MLDDDRFFLNLMEKSTVESGYEAVCFTGPENFFDALANGQNFCAVITDRMMVCYDAFFDDLAGRVRRGFDFQEPIFLHPSLFPEEQNSFDFCFDKSDGIDFDTVNSCLNRIYSK